MQKRLLSMTLAILLMLAVLVLGGCSSVGGDAGGNTIATEAAVAVLDVAATAATALISVAGAWALAKIGQNRNLTNLNIAIQQVVDAAQLTVGELQQTIVTGMKAAAEDGKLTEKQILSLKKLLLQKTMEKLTSPTVQLLEAAKLDVNALIRGAAEDMINSLHMTSKVLEQDIEIL